LRNRTIIYCATFIRATAIGLAGVLMGLYLARLDLSVTMIGVVVSAGLAGSAVAALIATLAADRLGRRRFLLALAMASAVGGLAVAVASSIGTLIVFAFAGMVNGMGRDRGPALVVEQAILSATASDDRRTSVFALYNILQAAGGGLGALFAGTSNLLRRSAGLTELGALRLTMGVYGALMLVTALLYTALTTQVETPAEPAARRVSEHSRGLLLRLSALFALDSLGGGCLTQALIAFFFARRFGVGVGTIGLLFFSASIANAASQFGAAYLARRIGLINTMVFTHIPANLSLVAVAFAPNFILAAALYLLRELMIQMDVPTRQSYVMAVVRPEERTFASGVTHLVRLGGWAIAPAFAGLFMEGVSLGAPLVAGSLLKVLYDILLFVSFRHLRPPEELETMP
jgi:MFS family permease